MRQREFVEFRTPQHPNLGTNHWGGASPLLARNIPKESLEQRYLKLNSIRNRDEIFPAQADEFNYLSQTHENKGEAAAPPTPSRSRKFLSKLILPKKDKAAALGSNSKKRRWLFPKWNPRHRWPQAFFGRMEKLISIKCCNMQSVPESYVWPPETRPGKFIVPHCETIPVIDLGGEINFDRTITIQQITKACQEFGFFQLIDHGVSEKLVRDVLNVAKEFFELPAKDKASLYSEDPKKSCRLYTSIDYVKEKVHSWRDNLRHPCHPTEEHMQFWPEKPVQYREVIGKYSVEVRKLSLWLLDLIREGLGLELGYFENELSQVQLMTLNHYPPCPDPSLTLGLPKHSDVNLITVLLQGDVHGLQVLKDGKWLAVEPIPNSFIINIGHILQIISNGKLRSADHRVVTNTSHARTTVASFIHPSSNSQIEPAKELINNCSPQLYIPFIYKDFLSTYISDTHSGIPPTERCKFKP